MSTTLIRAAKTDAARTSGAIIRLISAGGAAHDAGHRRNLAWEIIDNARRRGDLTGGEGVVLGHVDPPAGPTRYAAVCLTCAWVGEIGTDRSVALDLVESHDC